jgi:two-component system chemotaxis sensor kinase CheA
MWSPRPSAALRGTIHLDSEPGRGTVFRIQLPLTLAIIDGMLVRAGRQTYVLPMQAITRLVEPGTAVCIENILGRGLALSQPEGLVPSDPAGRPVRDGGMTTVRNPVLLCLEHLEQRLALQVDEVLGQQQVVIKSLGDGLRGIPGISGGCILADGRVGSDPGCRAVCNPGGRNFCDTSRSGGTENGEDGPAQGR